MNNQLEQLRKDEAELLERYSQAQANVDAARQKLQAMEWRLSDEQGNDRTDYLTLMNANENTTLDFLGAVILRRQSRDILIQRIQSAVGIAQANFKAAEQARAEAGKPLNQVRAEINDILERQRRLEEERIEAKYRQQAQAEINSLREQSA